MTTNNIGMTSTVNYAGFWRRSVGWLIDSLIIVVLAHWVLLPLTPVLRSQILNILASPSLISLQFFLVLIEQILINFIVIVVYYCVFEASPLQATIGKYIVGIKITDLGNHRITYGKAFLRRIYSLLSVIPLLIGYFVAGFTSKKQTFHDMLAKTVVVIKNKRSGGMLVMIVIVTIILGILSDMFLGAGFHVSFNSTTTHYDTQSGLQNYIVERGDKVDPVLQNAIINAFMTQKTIYASGDLKTIRNHFNIALPSGQAQQLVDMSDSDLKNLISFFNKIADVTTESLLRSPDATWSFNQNKTSVRISFKAKLTNGTFETVTIDEIYNNGQWYF